MFSHACQAGIVGGAMCFDDDSSPPIPVISGAAVSHEELVLDSADGNRFAAFAALPDESGDNGHRRPPRRPRPLPLLRGARTSLRRARLPGDRLRLLRPHGGRRQARRRLRVHAARAGGEAVGDSGRRRRVRRLAARGRERSGSSPSASAWAVATRGCRPPAATASQERSASTGARVRGRTAHRGRSSAPREMECPILALQAGDDQNITAEDNAAFEEALRAAGVAHEVVTYPGAPHSFFDRKQEDFEDASDDAWAASSRSSAAARALASPRRKPKNSPSRWRFRPPIRLTFRLPVQSPG